MVAQSTAPTARGTDCVAADASLVRAFDLLGKRWTGVLLGTLSSGPVGFRGTRSVSVSRRLSRSAVQVIRQAGGLH